jgi:hypothetical protein
MTDVVIVKSRTREGAQALLDRVCKDGDLRPVTAPEPMLGRNDRWTAQAVPAEQSAPPRRPTTALGRQIRRGHR